MKVKAIGHRVIVRPDPIEERTAGGIILNVNVDRERAAAQKGTVVDIGPLAWTNEVIFGKNPKPWCVVGDRVFFARYGGKSINLAEEGLDDDFVFVLNDEDLQALITEEQK
jgi:co-chaperonin GroES (HSP10)